MDVLKNALNTMASATDGADWETTTGSCCVMKLSWAPDTAPLQLETLLFHTCHRLNCDRLTNSISAMDFGQIRIYKGCQAIKKNKLIKDDIQNEYTSRQSQNGKMSTASVFLCSFISPKGPIYV